jgi:hypothetical protein
MTNISIEVVDYTTDNFFGEVIDTIDTEGKSSGEVGALIEEARAGRENIGIRMVETVPAIDWPAGS